MILNDKNMDQINMHKKIIIIMIKNKYYNKSIINILKIIKIVLIFSNIV